MKNWALKVWDRAAREEPPKQGPRSGREIVIACVAGAVLIGAMMYLTHALNYG